MLRHIVTGAVVAICWNFTVVQGAVVSSFAGSDGPGLGSVVLPDQLILTGYEGNDDLETNGLSSNLLTYDLHFAVDDYIDVIFNVTSGPSDNLVSEYDAVFPYNYNNTAVAWTGLRVQLGFFNGGIFNAAGTSGLDFDYPDPNSYIDANAFTGFVRTADEITFSGGMPLYSGNIETPAFSIDVPGQSAVPAYARTADGYQFVLRTTPISQTVPGVAVPEPTAVSIILLMGAMTQLLARDKAGIARK